MNTISSQTQVKPSLRNSLIQNFYIIGFSLDDFFKIDKKENKGTFLDIFENISDKNITPKIITKFPDKNIDNMNLVPDNIIIDHCFPNGKIELSNKDKNEYFNFEFDNTQQNYKNEDKKIYSKIYFNCLEIRESLLDYFEYKKEIVNLILENDYVSLSDKDKTLPLSGEDQKKYSSIFIPKVLCFASVLPFYKELSLLLEYIYNFYLSKQSFSFLPLEKVIEKIIINTPIPIKLKDELNISFDTDNYKQKLVFSQFNLNDLNINYSANISLVKLFELFTIDDIIKIFRYILYEMPILFFSDDKNLLSLFVNTFLTVLSPFKYIFPHVSILPKKLYGLIGSEKKFIFGINELYTEDFFEKNKIELNKTIIIVSVDINKANNNIQGKIEEKIYDSNNVDNIYITTNFLSKPPLESIKIKDIPTSVLNVDFPYYSKKKLSEGINKYLSFMKKKFFFSKKEPIPEDFTLKIQTVFYKFFVDIMQGYTDFLLKSKYLYNESFTKNINIGENIFIKNNYKFKKEVFNEDEFLAKIENDYIPFYKIFFNTDIFTNFLRERIYNNEILEQLAIKQFDQLTFLKKHSDMRKKKENKTLYESFRKDYIEKTNNPDKKEIIIKEETFDDKDLENFLTSKEKNVELLLNFAQLFKVKENIKDVSNNQNNLAKLIDIKYLVFPKLNFEYLYKSNYEKLKFLTDNYIIDYKTNCKWRIEDIEKIRPYAFYTKNFPKLKETNITEKNYEISSKNYLDYIWFLLLSSSLWYCEKEEKKYRLDKMLELLNNYENIEEYVLNFVLMNIYKSSDIFHLIKIFLLNYKLIGHTNYFLLNLLCDKIQSISEEENEEYENSINANNAQIKKDLVYAKRYLINPSYNLGEKEKKENNIEADNKGDVDELIFCSEQQCPKCKHISNIDVKAISESNKDLSLDCHKYQCEICKENNDIIIKYQILKYNISDKEMILTETGYFKFLTPYKLYRDLKTFFIKENITELDIDKIFYFGNEMNLYNIIFYFSLFNLSFDFLFPYEERLRRNIKLFFESFKTDNIINTDNNYKHKLDKPIKLNFSHSQISFRRFNNIQPLFNPKKKNNKFMGIIKLKDKYVDSELSFTIKSNKTKKK